MSYEELLYLKDFVFEKRFDTESNRFVLCVWFRKCDYPGIIYYDCEIEKLMQNLYYAKKLRSKRLYISFPSLFAKTNSFFELRTYQNFHSLVSQVDVLRIINFIDSSFLYFPYAGWLYNHQFNLNPLNNCYFMYLFRDNLYSRICNLFFNKNDRFNSPS